MLTARDFAALIGSSQATVNRRRQAGAILALGKASGGFRYPKWQIMDDGRLVPGLKELASEMPGP